MSKEENNNGNVLGKRNYMLLAIGFVFIIFGYLLMTGGKATDPNVFSEELFSTTRITIAPVLVLLGFAIDVVALTLKPKE